MLKLPTINQFMILAVLGLTAFTAVADNDPDGSPLICAEGPSDKRPTVMIEDCDSGVKNRIVGRCTIADLLRTCQPKALDERARCYAKTTNALKEQGSISGKEKGAMQICAADDRKIEGEQPDAK